MNNLRNFKYEILFLIILALLLLLFVDPLSLIMPSIASMMALFALTLVFLIYVIFVWREKPRDEREQFHTMLASRVAFLSGAAVLIVGITIQTLRHALDIWLVVALFIMVVVKIITLIYTSSKH